jgi:hypothetical protein
MRDTAGVAGSTVCRRHQQLLAMAPYGRQRQRLLAPRIASLLDHPLQPQAHGRFRRPVLDHYVESRQSTQLLYRQ